MNRDRRERKVITMHTKQRTLAWILFLIWMVPGLAFAERKGRLVGKVLDPEGKPIPGVAVIVTSPQIPGFRDIETTDKRGVFMVDFSQLDVNYHYRFDKPGFTSMEFDQRWSLEGSTHQEWTMQPGASAAFDLAPGGPPPASKSDEAISAYNAGVLAARDKSYAMAAAKFGEAVQHDPNLRQAWESLSLAQLSLDHNQEAAEAAEKAIALGSADPAVLTARWQAYRSLKDDAKAAAALKDLERIGRRTEEAKKIHNQAVALQKAGDYAGAFAKFQEALNVDPNLQVSLVGLANAALKIGKPLEAATAAETILKADPTNEQAIRLRYNACLALGEKGRLLGALKGLAPYEPRLARDGILRVAFDAYDANDMPTARKRFDEALTIDPNYPQAYYYLALIDVSQGATADAKSHIERFLQLAPNDPEANSAREMLKYLSKP
jgi:tetratricopeptide (TPR) repeat protein